ncbi:hypothetical protein STPH1_1632 [Streptomyces sp. OM5714]|nr:hypothetical protein STPH1_1632 [Streptomyces sp. OM5714]
MAAAMGMSPSTLSRIWRAFAPASHRSQTCKLFIDKVRDIVGLYLDPPEKPWLDKRSQIQALDRPQPVPPMTPGVPALHSHGYVRVGTTSRFAALGVATGKVIGSLHRRHRAAEFMKFHALQQKCVLHVNTVHYRIERAAELTVRRVSDRLSLIDPHAALILHRSRTKRSEQTSEH